MKIYKVWTSDLSAPVLIIKAENLQEAVAQARQENPAYTHGEEYRQAGKCPYYRRQRQKERRTSWTGQTYYTEVTMNLCYHDKSLSLRCSCAGRKDKCQVYPKIWED